MPKRAFSVASSTSDECDASSSAGSLAASISTAASSSSSPNKRRNTGATTAKAPEHETKENRKAARKERNRISAQLSRDRKKHEKESLESRLESAEQQVRLLTQENAQLKAQITKNKDVEDQLEGLRLRFLELERMMLAAAGSSRSPSTQPVTTGSQQTTAKVEVDESEAVAVEREQGAERRPGLSNQTDVVEAPSSSASPADEEQDSRIGNETSAAVLDAAHDPLHATSTTAAAAATARPEVGVATLVKSTQDDLYSATPVLGTPAAGSSKEENLTSSSPFYFLADEHLLLSPPTLSSLPGQATDGQQGSSTSSIVTADGPDVEPLDQDLLAGFLTDEGLLHDRQDESDQSQPETDLFFGFSYEALVDESHRNYFDSLSSGSGSNMVMV